MTRKSRRVVLAQSAIPSPVLPLVTELRMRAAQSDNELGGVLARNHGDGTGPEGSYYNGRREGFQIAADLLEADPLYKAGLEAIEIVKEIGAHIDLWFEDDHHVPPDRIKSLIDSLPLPKEASK